MNVQMVGLSPENLHAFPMHAHACWEIVVFITGTGIHTVGEQAIPFQPGLIVCQPPHLPHGTVSDQNYRDIYIQVDNFIPPTTELIPAFHDDEDRRFTRLLQMMLESFHKREANYRNIVLSLYMAAYQLLVGWSETRTTHCGFVESLIHEMVLNISNPEFNIAQTIRRSGYCSDYVRRSFKKMTGKTPTAYMNGLRISQACKLLSGTAAQQITIRQVALMSGFTDPYYFSVMFKKQTGFSPSVWSDNHP